jgi:hypothetical protein
MPRGSRPGERRGGRQRGTPNKKTALRNAAIAAAVSNPNVSPLEFLLSIMRDFQLPFELRIRVAQMAAPFVHPKPRSTLSIDQNASGKLIDTASLFTMDPPLAKRLRDDDVRLHELYQKEVNPKESGGPLTAADEEERAMLRARVDETVKTLRCPPGYGAIEARKDRHRLDDFFYKRLEIRRRGGTLTDAEDAEEAQLTARVAAFEQTPEGRGRHRIFELEWRGRLNPAERLSPAEQLELKILQGLYPELPPDPDHVLAKFGVKPRSA